MPKSFNSFLTQESLQKIKSAKKWLSIRKKNWFLKNSPKNRVEGQTQMKKNLHFFKMKASLKLPFMNALIKLPSFVANSGFFTKEAKVQLPSSGKCIVLQDS